MKAKNNYRHRPDGTTTVFPLDGPPVDIDTSDFRLIAAHRWRWITLPNGESVASAIALIDGARVLISMESLLALGRQDRIRPYDDVVISA